MPENSKGRPASEFAFFAALLVLGAIATYHPELPGDLLVFSTFTASKWCALGIGICAALELISLFKTPPIVDSKLPESPATTRTAIFIVGLAIYCLSLFYISYYPATTVVMLVGFLFLGGRKFLLPAIVATACWLLLVHLLFERIFVIVLPGVT